MRRTAKFTFSAVRSEGGLLPHELLERVAALDSALSDIKPTAYYLAEHEPLGEAISRSWLRLLGCWRALRAALDKLPANDPAVRLTRERWLYPLFQELGFGRLTTTRTQPIELDGRTFPISHVVGPVPIHLLGVGVDLDRATKGVEGATQPPHSVVQDLLNRSEDHLWALLCNGLRLRLLRDHHSLTRQAFVEFDLEAIFAGERFADFRVLWLCCHHSRLVPPEGSTRPGDCPLERWFQHVRTEGMRALDRLRDGVQAAIVRLGNGFLQHPRNTALDAAFRRGALTGRDYYRQLLRLAYRLIFLFVAEDRNALLPALPEDAPPEARAAQDRYRRYYATTNLRALAQRRRGGPHADRWQALRLVLGHLHGGCPDLGLPALGSFLWSPEATPDLDRCELANADLLAALHALCTFDDGHTRRVVNWHNIGADELGSVYEALLELHPEVLREARVFKLEVAPGHERKTTGAYYTPSDLVECLLDTALDPVLDEAERTPNPAAVLLDLKICDPACGSGHFLLAAGRRLARRLAQVRAGVREPSPNDLRDALRDVVGRCLYGVDINDMAVELCKVSLWMEALKPGRPLSFLDNHIQPGNALLGATPELLTKGVPEAAFEALTGDDPAVARRLKKRSRDEHSRSKAQGVQMGLGEAAPTVRIDTSAIARRAADIDQLGDGDLVAVTTKQRRYLEFIDSPEHRDARLLADAWCAAFVWPKSEASETIAPTQALLQILHRDPSSAPIGLRDMVDRLAATYQFFHWHLAFPHVFAQPRGGFDVVLGNPPWERIKLQEREFFATRAPEIAKARNAAERKKVIAALERKNPALWEEWLTALRQAEGESHQIRNSGRYPLCSRGDINTYAIFAELNRGLIRDRGRVGCIVPAGIAMDDTTKQFFADLVQSRTLAALLHFENEDRLFADLHHAYRFVLLTLSGSARPVESATFVAYARDVSAVLDPERSYSLSPDDFSLINPNSRTFPAFRLRRDAELTRAIHRRVPVLVRDFEPALNPWNIGLQTMLHMTNDSNLFRTKDSLLNEGWRPIGTIFSSRGKQHQFPLYEAKMIHHFDHRYGTYDGQSQAQANQGSLPYLTPEQHNDPRFWALPRYWVDSTEATTRLDDLWNSGWFIGWRDITGSEKTRTVIASILPRYCAGNTIFLALPREHADLACALAANLSSFALDFVARQKMGGTHLNFHSLKQLPILAPSVYTEPCPWVSKHVLGVWLRPRILELTYTAWDLTAFARDHGWDGPPFCWDENRRFLLRAELDAAFFHLYGITKADDVAYILDTFPIVRQRDQKEHGTYRTKDQILALHERMRQAMAGGPPYITPLDPRPADPSLTHPPIAPDDPLWSVIPQTRPPTSDAAGAPVPSTRTAAPADPAQPGVGTTAALFPDEPAARPPARARTKPARTVPPADASPPTFELAPPPGPQPHLFAAVPPTPAKPKSASAASFHLYNPAAPNQHLFATQPPPSEPPTPAPAHAVPGSNKVLPFRPAVRPQQSAAVAPADPHRDLPAWSPDLLSAVATTTGLPASAGRWGTTRTGVNLGIAALAAVLRNMGGPASRDEVERAVVLSVLPTLLQSKFDAKTAPKWRRAIGKANMSLTSIAVLSISWAEVIHRATVEHLLAIDADGHWFAGADINDVPTGELDARALVALSWLASVSGASVEDAELVTQLGVLRVA